MYKPNMHILHHSLYLLCEGIIVVVGNSIVGMKPVIKIECFGSTNRSYEYSAYVEYAYCRVTYKNMSK